MAFVALRAPLGNRKFQWLLPVGGAALASMAGAIVPRAPWAPAAVLAGSTSLLAILLAPPSWFTLLYVFSVPFSAPALAVGTSWEQGFGFTLTPYLVCLAAGTAAWVPTLVRTKWLPRLRWTLADTMAMLLLATNLASSMSVDSPARALRLDLNLASMLVAYFLVRMVSANPTWLPKITLTVTVSALTVSLLGLAQYLVYAMSGDQLPLIPMTKVPFAGPRLQSTLAGPNYFGSFAVMALPPILWATRGAHSRKDRFLLWLTVVTLVGATFLTFSRFNQVLVASIVALFFAWSIRRVGSWLMIASIVAVGLVTWSFATEGLQERTLSALQGPFDEPNWLDRLEQFQQGVEMFVGAPLLGVGPGQATLILPLSYGEPNVIHNDLLNRFAEGGLLGGGAFVLFLVALFWQGGRAVSALQGRDAYPGILATGWLISLLFAVLDFQFYPHFYEPTNWLLYGVVASIGASEFAYSRSEEDCRRMKPEQQSGGFRTRPRPPVAFAGTGRSLPQPADR